MLLLLDDKEPQSSPPQFVVDDSVAQQFPIPVYTIVNIYYLAGSIKMELMREICDMVCVLIFIRVMQEMGNWEIDFWFWICD